MTVKELLLKEREIIKEDIVKIENPDECSVYKTYINRLTEIDKLLVDLESKIIDSETKIKIQEIDSEIKKTEQNNMIKENLKRNLIDILKISLPIVGAFGMGVLSMKFEKTDILTSTAGKASLRDLIKFK